MSKFFLAIILIAPFCVQAQSETAALDSLKKQILQLQVDVETIQLNLGESERKFKRSIFVATLGYTITIAGGLMLGRENDELGKVLLVSGGAVGATGTVLMVDSFKYLGRASRRKR